MDSPRYHEVDARSLLRRATLVDPWFLGRFGSNLYRGCEHGCVYCDGRAERYHVAGRFDRDIEVKRNAPTLLAAELDKLREPGFLFVGGGVCDAYQPAERRYALARGLLELCAARRVPVHLLTKSALVERDLDLLVRINAASRAVLSFSIALVEEGQRRVFEPAAAPLEERWRLLQRAHELGLGTGVMAMPLLPGLSDQPAQIDRLIERAQRAGVDFVCPGGLTLRPGIQKEGFFATLGQHFPELLPGYHRLFREARTSGIPDRRYLERLDARLRAALQAHRMPGRMPARLFHGLLPLYTELAVRLEHRGFDRGEPAGGRGALARAGWAIGQWARARLNRQRGRHAYRLVESELALLAHSRQLQRIPELDESVIPDVEDLFAVITGRKSPDPG